MITRKLVFIDRLLYKRISLRRTRFKPDNCKKTDSCPWNGMIWAKVKSFKKGPIKSGHLFNTEQLFCADGVRFREIPMYNTAMEC